MGAAGHSGAAAPRGPRPAGTDTRGAILAAAAEVFTSLGFDNGSVRAVARAAGVDPALVRHYFASKEELFVEALRPPIDLEQHVVRLADGDPELVGHRVMAFFVESWGDSQQGPRILTLMRGALDHPAVAAVVQVAIVERVIGRLAAAVGAPDPATSAALAASQVFGLAMLRHAAAIEPLASMPAEDLIALYGPVVTRLLRGHTATP